MDRMNAKHFRELRAWQAAYAFKLRIYDLIEQGSLATDEKIHKQLREGSASAPSQIAEGHITEQVREEHDQLAREALKEIAGLIDYLHSPEAKRNADRIRQQRQERRARRKTAERNQKQRNQEQRNGEQPNGEQQNPEPRTGTQNTNPEQ